MTAQDAAAICARVREVCEHIYGGNKSSMAADLGVTHSIISKITTGQQRAPGLRVLFSIAQKRVISADWLLFGRGTMFYTPRVKDRKP